MKTNTNKFAILRVGSRLNEDSVTENNIYETHHRGKILGPHSTTNEDVSFKNKNKKT